MLDELIEIEAVEEGDSESDEVTEAEEETKSDPLFEKV